MARRAAVLLIAAVVLIAAALGVNRALQARGRAVPEVDVAEVAARDLVEWVIAGGVVEPFEPHFLRAPLAGRVASVAVQRGDAVTAGQPLADYDRAPLELRRLEAERELAAAGARLAELTARLSRQEQQTAAELAQAETRLRQAQANRDRARGLPPWDPQIGIAESQYAEAVAAHDLTVARLADLSAQGDEILAARAAVRVAEVSLQLAQTRLAAASVVAPAGGVVLEVGAQEGAVVSEGQLLFTLAGPDRVRIVARVDEIDIGRVRTGAPAEVYSTAFVGRSFAATVERVAPAARRDGNLATFDVTLVAGAEGALRPGMSVEVNVEAEVHAGVLALPLEALVQRRDGAGAFVVDGRVARFRPVTTGAITGTHAQVLAGLEPDDWVITGPADVLRNLADGRRVRVRDRAGAASGP